MLKTDVKEQEQEWIAKYRAALDAVSKKEPYSHGLGAFLDLVRTHFKLGFRSTSYELRTALESGKNEVEIPSTQAPIGNGQAEVSCKQLACADLECGKERTDIVLQERR